MSQLCKELPRGNELGYLASADLLHYLTFSGWSRKITMAKIMTSLVFCLFLPQEVQCIWVVGIFRDKWNTCYLLWQKSNSFRTELSTLKTLEWEVQSPLEGSLKQ